jgi:putative DNA primase/helicase
MTENQPVGALFVQKAFGLALPPLNAPMLDHALYWALLGFHVFPVCMPTADGRCGCGRKKGPHTERQEIGKCPLIKDWQKEATHAPAQISTWWCGRWANANIGALNNERSGIIVVDNDKDSDEARQLRAWLIPQTRVHQSGGADYKWHGLFLRPPGLAIPARHTTVLGINLESSGQFLLPPSRHRSGGRYEIVSDLPIAPMPPDLLKYLQSLPLEQRSKAGERPERKKRSAVASRPEAGSLAAAVVGGLKEVPPFTDYERASLESALSFHDANGVWVLDPREPSFDAWANVLYPLAWLVRHGWPFAWVGFVFDYWSKEAEGLKDNQGRDVYPGSQECARRLKQAVEADEPAGRGPRTVYTLYELVRDRGWNPLPAEAVAQAPQGQTGASDSAAVPPQQVGAPQPAPNTLECVWASEVDPVAIDWFWPGRFSLGALSLMVGLPGEGKSQLGADMAARTTKGSDWPCEEGKAPQGSVVVLSSEDSPNAAIVPRLIAAGAALDRVRILKMVRVPEQNTVRGNKAVREPEKKRMFDLADDLPLLKHAIVGTRDVKLVLIDPISSYFGAGKVDTFRDTDVRAILGPLCELAEELHIAVVAVMHFNKKTDVTNALLRISNSIAFGATARHVYAVVHDPDSKRWLFVRAKNNYAPSTQQALAYSFATRKIGNDSRTKQDITAPYIEWHAQHVDVTATEAMQAAIANKTPTQRDAAKKFLQGMLTAGPVPQAQVEDAAKGNGISKRTLERAKHELNIVATKDGEGGTWSWRLPLRPPGPPPRTQVAPTTSARH